MAGNLFFGNLKPHPGSGGKVRLRRRPNFEFTENPKVRRSSYTSDDDDSVNLQYKVVGTVKEVPQHNAIFDEQTQKDGVKSPDLCTRMSVMVVSNEQQQQQQQKSSTSMSFGDRVSFTTVHNSRHPLQELERTPVRKSLAFEDDPPVIGQSFDTVVSDDAIEILDSDDENEMDRLQPAEVRVSDSYINCSSTVASHSDFFNDIPVANHAVSHSMIQRFKGKDARCQERPPPMQILSVVQRSMNEHVEIGPTDEEDQENEEPVDLTLDESDPKMTPVLTNRNLHTPGVISAKVSRSGSSKKHTSINIKFDLKISIRGGSGSSSSSSSSSSSEEEEKTPEKPKKVSKDEPKVDAQCGRKPHNIFEDLQVCHTPKNTEEAAVVLDEELQGLLTDLYGDGWKTPQLLKSCKSKRFRENLRKSLHGNNFESCEFRRQFHVIIVRK
jgi:hypothetical protein